MAELSPLPEAKATLTVSNRALDSIPNGHTLSSRDGRATANLSRTPDGEALVVTATCDSLTRQLMLYEEAYDYMRESFEARADSLRTAFERYRESESKKPPNWSVALIAFLAGLLIGGVAVESWKL